MHITYLYIYIQLIIIQFISDILIDITVMQNSQTNSNGYGFSRNRIYTIYEKLIAILAG